VGEKGRRARPWRVSPAARRDMRKLAGEQKSEAAGKTNAMFCAEGETGCSSSWSILGREIDMGERCAGDEGSHVQWIAGDLVVGRRG
jgi:hypothetical protein